MSAPEPLWWVRACELRAKGLSVGVIARLCRKHHVSVLFATDAEWREKRRAAMKARGSVAGSHNHGKRARARVVEKAHRAAAITGQHVDAVLLAWGERPRRARADA